MPIRSWTAKGYGTKRIDLTLISLARHCAAYMNYMQFRKATDIFYENSLRIPCIEVAQSYKWDFECEFKLKDDPKHTTGAYKKIDFVIAYYKQIIGIECKYVKESRYLRTEIHKDYDKLTNLFFEDSIVRGYEKKYGCILLAYYGAHRMYDFGELGSKQVIEDNESIGSKKILKPKMTFMTNSQVGKYKFGVSLFAFKG